MVITVDERQQLRDEREQLRDAIVRAAFGWAGSHDHESLTGNDAVLMAAVDEFDRWIEIEQGRSRTRE